MRRRRAGRRPSARSSARLAALLNGAPALVLPPDTGYELRTAEALYAAMGPAIEASGGSAGNTAAGVASLGGRAAFIGKVADDALGRFYRHDMRAAGVRFETPPLTGGAPTARSAS